MTSDPSHRLVSALRQRMIEDMSVRGLTENTRGDYVRNVRAFAVFIGRSPDTATAEDLRRRGDVRPDQLPWYVRRLGKAKMRLDLPKTAAERTCLNPVCACHSGMFSVMTRTSRTVQCSTLLCFRLRNKVTGISSVCAVRKTAMPETRASAASSQVARKVASGIVSLARRVSTNRRPARQVVMIVKTTRPITNGKRRSGSSARLLRIARGRLS